MPGTIPSTYALSHAILPTLSGYHYYAHVTEEKAVAQLSLSKLPQITQSEPRQSSARTHTLNHDSAANPLRERPWSLMSNRDCEQPDRQSKYYMVDCVGSESPGHCGSRL